MTAQAPVYVIEDGVPIPDAYRPYLESPRAVAADLGISTAEVLSLLRGDPAKHHFTLHPVRDGNVVWIVRPYRVAKMQRRASLRSEQHAILNRQEN